MQRRVLIVSVSAGAGHLRAAQAVTEALELSHPGVEVRNIDAMDYAPPAFRRLYAKLYLDLVNHAPALWGRIFAHAERTRPTALTARLNRLMEQLNSRRLVRFAAEFEPHEILAVHPLPMDVFNRLRRRGRLSARLSVAVTDFDVHPLWIDPRTDRYFASCEECAHRLLLRGIEASRVVTTGIPVVPPFASPVPAQERRRLRDGLNLRGDKACVLVSAGGFGVGRVREVASVLAAAAGRADGADLLVVAGRNGKLRAELAAMPVPRGVGLTALGFVSNMHELMAAADVMVSKPGGLTSSECLARSLPMIIVDPIPGQEERNATHLLEGGAACLAATPEALDYRLCRLLGADSRLADMRRAASALARPRAAFDVADALAAG